MKIYKHFNQSLKSISILQKITNFIHGGDVTRYSLFQHIDLRPHLTLD